MRAMAQQWTICHVSYHPDVGTHHLTASGRHNEGLTIDGLCNFIKLRERNTAKTADLFSASLSTISFFFDK